MGRIGFWILVAITVLLAFVSAAFAETVGDWTLDPKHQTAPYAASINDSGQILGQWCVLEEGVCHWLLALDAACKEGDRYPILANSSAGSVHLDVRCTGRLESGKVVKYRYEFANFEAVDGLLRQVPEVGFAMPLATDQFVVVRFSLRGAVAALADMRAAAGTRLNRPTARDTRDQRL